jgi:MFS family permease
MARKWPRFETVAVSAVLLGLGFGFTALASNFTLFALSVAIWTLGEIAGTAVGPTIIADLSPVDLRGLYQGIFGAAWGLSYFLGPLVGGWVYENLGADTLWISCLATGIVSAFCYLALSAPARRQMAQSGTPSN